MTLSVLSLTDDELRTLIDESVKYLGETIVSERFSGDDALDYTSGCIDILVILRDLAYEHDYSKYRAWFNKIFTADPGSDDHPSNLATYMAIPPAWDDFIVHLDE